MSQLSLQRFELLAEQKYNSPNTKLRDTADAELCKSMDIENNPVGKICELLYTVIEQSNKPYAHLEAVNIVKSVWERGKLSDHQEESFATVTVRTILNRYFRLPSQSQVFLKELIPFTLFKHPTTWASKVIGEILKPFTISYYQEVANAANGMQQQVALKTFPKAAEVVLINALIDIPKNMKINNPEIFIDNSSGPGGSPSITFASSGSGGISIRRSILGVLKFVKGALLLGYGVASLRSLDSEQLKACGIDRSSLDGLCMLLLTCAKTGKRFASGSDNTCRTINRSLKNKIMIYNLSGYSIPGPIAEDALVAAFYSNRFNETDIEDETDIINTKTITNSNGTTDMCIMVDSNNNNEDLGFDNSGTTSVATQQTTSITTASDGCMDDTSGKSQFPSLLELSSHYITLYITHLMKTRDETCLAPLTALAGTLSRMAKRATNIPQDVVNTYALIANKAFETMLGVPSPQRSSMTPNINYPIQTFNPTQNNESFALFITQAHEAAHEIFMMTKNVFGMLSNSSCNDVDSLNKQLLVLLIFRMTEVIHLLVMNESLLEMWQSGMTAYATLIKCLCELTQIGKRKTKRHRIKSADSFDILYDGIAKPEDSVPSPQFQPGLTTLQRVSMIFDTTPGSGTTVFRCPGSPVQFPSDLSGVVPMAFIKAAVVTSASYIITLFTTQYGRYINSLYTQAERQGDSTFSLPSVSKNGKIDHGPGSDRHIEESARSPLIEDCCPSDFWYILRIIPLDELTNFTAQAEPMIKVLTDLGPRATPEGLSRSPFTEAEYIEVVGTTVNLAWMMAVISVALVLDVPLSLEYRVRTIKAVLHGIFAAEIARKILGFNSPTIKYLETTIISSLRAIVAHHLTCNYSDYEFISELGSAIGVDNGINNGILPSCGEIADEDEVEMADGSSFRIKLRLKQPANISRIFSKLYSIIISKLLLNINIYQQSSLQSHSVKLLHQIVRQLPPVADGSQMIEDVSNLLKMGPLKVLDSIIIDPNPAGRAVRLGKGLSGVIASILRSLHDTNPPIGTTPQSLGLDTTIVNMLVEHYDVLARFACEGADNIGLTKALVSLRGFLPALIRTPEFAFMIVKMFILYCPVLDAIVENSLKNSTNTNNYVGFLSIVKFILKMFISILKSGVGELMDSLRSNGSSSNEKGVNTVAYSSPYLHVSSILCSFVTSVVTSQGKINAALKILSERAASSPIVNPVTLSSCICCSCNMVDMLMANPQSDMSGRMSYRPDSGFCLDMMVNEDLLFPYLSGTLSLVPILHSLVGRNSGMSHANSDIVNRKKYLHTTIVTVADILSRFPFILLGNPNLDQGLVSFLYKESCSLIGMRVFGIGLPIAGAASLITNDNISLLVGLRSLLPLVTTALHCRRSFCSMNNLNQYGEEGRGPKMSLGSSGFITPQMFIFIKDCCALKPDISGSTQDFIKGVGSLLPPLTLVFKHVLMILLDKASGGSGESIEYNTIIVLGSLLLLSIYKFYNASDRSNLWSVVSLGIGTWARKEERTASLTDSLKSAFDNISEDFRVRETDIQYVREEVFRISKKIHKQ